MTSTERPILARTRHWPLPGKSRTLLHGGTVVLPYGCSDSSVRIATVDLAQLLAELTG